jgi:hypothetical protein
MQNEENACVNGMYLSKKMSLSKEKSKAEISEFKKKVENSLMRRTFYNILGLFNFAYRYNKSASSSIKY